MIPNYADLLKTEYDHWFAWRPVFITDEKGDLPNRLVWLCLVKRRWGAVHRHIDGGWRSNGSDFTYHGVVSLHYADYP